MLYILLLSVLFKTIYSNNSNVVHHEITGRNEMTFKCHNGSSVTFNVKWTSMDAWGIRFNFRTEQMKSVLALIHIVSSRSDNLYSYSDLRLAITDGRLEIQHNIGVHAMTTTLKQGT